MFESMFPEAIQRRAQQTALDTYKATLEYQQVRRDNPTMLEQNYVDFSNPESVARMQNAVINPYGTYNPYANPNLVQQNYGYNPSQWSSYSYGGWGTSSWYGSWGGGYDTRFMTPSEDDKLIPIGKVSKGLPPPTERRKSLKEKMEQKQVVTVVRGNPNKQQTLQSKKEPQNQTNYKVITAAPVYHPPMTPYTMAELNPDSYQLKVITDTPLVWTIKDEKDIERLSEDLAVYDKAMAHVLYNVPSIESCTREDFNYIKIYFQERLQDFRSKELINQSFDYRAKYRHRRLPPTVMIDGALMPDFSKPVPVPLRTISLSGESVYDYDRGRDELTQEEWDIFIDRAYGEMLRGAEAIKAKDLQNLNKELAKPVKKQQTQDNTKYNPYDPISRKLYQMKNEQKNYLTHMDFFKHVFRNILSPEQFDNWWYGTRTNAIRYSGKQVDPNEAQKIWSRQMSENNYNSLLQFKPYDPEVMKAWFNRTATAAINGYTKGTVSKDMSLADFMRNLAYLDTRNHELNLEAQQRANQQNMWNAMSHNTFQKSLAQYLSTPGYTNPNPNYTPQYGTIDPRFGSPNQVIDLTNNPLAQQKKAQFLAHCQSTQGNVPLQPIYR